MGGVDVVVVVGVVVGGGGCGAMGVSTVDFFCSFNWYNGVSQDLHSVERRRRRMGIRGCPM